MLRQVILFISCLGLANLVQAQAPSIFGKWNVQGKGEGYAVVFNEDYSVQIIVPKPKQESKSSEVVPNETKKIPKPENFFMINTRATPHEIDMIITHMGKSQVVKGIMEFIDENTLRTFYQPNPNKDRPEKFPEEGEAFYELIDVMKRDTTTTPFNPEDFIKKKKKK